MHDATLSSHGKRLSPGATVVACGALLAALILVSAALLPTSDWFAYKAAAGYVVAATLVSAYATRSLAPGAFGLANTVTLLRAALTALLLGIAYETATAEVLWFCVIVATIALVLDGVDGWLARRRHETSSFGARFDMETDAALMVVLSVLVWLFDRAGAWILLAGALRYVFIGVPRLRRPLPASTRHKAACVVQLIALVVALGPIIPPPLAAAAAAAGLAVLVVSFALDVVWLLRHA